MVSVGSVVACAEALRSSCHICGSLSMEATARRFVFRIPLGRPDGGAVDGEGEGMEVLQDHRGEAFVLCGGAAPADLERLGSYALEDAAGVETSRSRTSEDGPPVPGQRFGS